MRKRKILYIALSLLFIGSLAFPGSRQASALPASPTDESKVPHYFGPYPNYANSAFTLADAFVAITGDGSGAAATAVVGANGAVTGVTVTNPGSGYTTANVSITNSTATNTSATASATIATVGAVTKITVDTPGANYTTPLVNITGGGAPTILAAATAYGGVDHLNLTNAGAGYTFPTIDFDMPDDPAGVQAKAHVASIALGDPVDGLDPLTGAITAVVLDNPGSGYAKAPNVVIRDGTLYSPLNNRAELRAQAAQAQGLNVEKSGDMSLSTLVSIASTADATVAATLSIQYVKLDVYGDGYTATPGVSIVEGSVSGAGAGATATATTDVGAITAITVTNPGSGYITQGGIKKFEDGLPKLCLPSANYLECATTSANNLGQYMPIAVPDTTTFTTANGFSNDADFYVIALVQHREQMSSSLPAGTLNREYVQLETPVNQSFSKHVALQNDLLDGTSVPALMPDGSQAYAVDDPHYMGPIISATKDRPVRIVFYNLLPTGSDGDLFIPVDTTFMGSGEGPMDMSMAPMDMGTVTDGVRNPACGETTKDRSMCFAETRASIHLHGGITPWISDGSPHQWITPANEQTGWPEGVAVAQVPDMVGQGAVTAGIPDCSAANDGCTTFYYTNQQSARLLFYHDHAWGITRLNVYAGEAAGYLITDTTEQKLIADGTIPADQIPLVIQDRTFVPSPEQMAQQDPTWDYSRYGGEGNLWYEHVYMPAQNPGDPSGMSAYGRWMYGPWFWPPATPTYGPIDNPYYNMDPKGPDGIRGTADDWTTPLAKPCSLDDPTTWQYDVDPFCEPPQMPGTPNNSAGMEQFNDTPIVNGTAYPTVTVDPKSYRLRILNAANDRFWNLQWYVADPSTASTSLNQYGEVIGGTEVALKASEVAAAQTDPNVFPTPDTTISPPGPSWIQIGTESGFLAAPTIIPNQPITWITDPTRFDVGNVDQHSLLLAPAERADVIVDFSQYAGKTLILYNDAPAAFPARVGSYDYYTGAPDLSPVGAPGILPGYGPNTRTIMQVKVAATAPAQAFNYNNLYNAFKHHADGTGVFESGQTPIVVGQAAYNTAYGTNFASGADCNSPVNPTAKCDGFARINQQGGDTFKFDTLKGAQIGVTIQPKAIHDETNSTNFEPYGRMSGNLGVEAVPATPNAQNVVLYPFVNPPTEIFNATNLPTTDTLTPISVGSDGTEIWKITHNGVDTHPIHFHLYDVQVLNRVTWDNIIIPPDPNEVGWKDTVRVSPLEDTYFAIRPIIPTVPWELPNSIRPLNPMMPLGDTTMFNPTDPNGNPTTPIVNALVNFGWEYMLHCHILSHEEMDMMRPVVVAIAPNKPDGLAFAISGNGNNTRLTLTWNDNSINETDFVVQRMVGAGAWTDVGTVTSPLDQPNTHRVLNLADTAFRAGSGTYSYRVVANNTVGLGGSYPSTTASSTSDPIVIIFPPTNLTASVVSATSVSLRWTDNATNETGFVIQRSTDGVVFDQVGTAPARNNTGTVTFIDTTVTQGNTYIYRVAATTATQMSTFSNLATILVDVPPAPTNLRATKPIALGNRESVPLSWTDNASNESGFTIQWSTSSLFTGTVNSMNLGANATTQVITNLSRVTWYFRIRANNALGSSAWATTGQVLPASPALTPPASPLVFLNNFTYGLSKWSGHTGEVQAETAAAMGGAGGYGLAAAWGSDSEENTTGQPAYVYYQIGNPLGSMMANFFFNPVGAITSDTPVDIFTGLDNDGFAIFGVQYLHTAGAPDVFQVRGWAFTQFTEIYTDWVPVTDAEHNLQLDWQSDVTSSLNLYVDGDLLASAGGDTSAYKLVQVRLGPSAGVDSILLPAGVPQPSMVYLDEFICLSNDIASPYTFEYPIYLPFVVSQ